MKNKNNYFKNTCFSIITIILISTSVIATYNIEKNRTSNELFKQEPYTPNNPYADCYASTIKFPHVVYDDFWDVTAPIGGVHWWGQSGTYNDHWYICDPEGMTFNVIFYENNNGYPGDIICKYTDVIPSITPTGLNYEYENHIGQWEMQYFEVQLYPKCSISEGWISIYDTGSNNGCSFLWVNSPDGNKNSYQTRGQLVQLGEDFAYILTSGLPTPDLKCNGGITWNDVKTGETVKSSFTVENDGEEDSLLDWKIDKYPVWGDDWVFTPSSGDDLTPAEGEITIEVSVIAPYTTEITWDGEIKIVNKNYNDDFEIIPVSLTTPKTKAVSKPFLTFLENNPHLFPLIRQILGL